MSAQLVDVKGDAGDLFHHPFVILALLSRPLQDIQVVQCLAFLLQIYFSCDDKGFRKGQMIVSRGMIIPQVPGLLVPQKKTKRQVQLKNSSLIPKDVIQMGRHRRWLQIARAKVVPIVKTVDATKQCADLHPFLLVDGKGTAFFLVEGCILYGSRSREQG